MRTLKNPLHLFRIDGVLLTLPLFRASLLPRGDYTTKELNQALANRHLYFNGVAPIKHSHIMSRQFYDKSQLDFRVEDEVLPEIRYKAIFKETFETLATTRTRTSKKFRKQAKIVLPELAMPGTDILFILNSGGFFASNEEILREILVALNYFKCVKPGAEVDFPANKIAPRSISDSEWLMIKNLPDLKRLCYIMAASAEDVGTLIDQINFIRDTIKQDNSDLAV
mmetsp:Transcript_20463/g.38311  ORF Transcript_20463/g.38311 Transcript_20463/m.38311 type:complete len:225 (-) Transcript_20463:5906-6580(-)